MTDFDRDNIFSVSEINSHIKNVLETNLLPLMVEGELANFVRHRSGHIYFSLKDERSSIRCVFFRSYVQRLDFNPKEGDKVICKGRITVFEKAGSYQLNVTKMIPSGIGELQIKFEKLKNKLSAEGLFDAEHKKKLPSFPQTIGVVTSSSGAAIRDIKNVIERRFPVKILLYPATVQGDNAASEVIKGIKYFNDAQNVDLIIIGRGGGSQEDLFCFNDENLAYEIFKSKLPIISAVGHEIDFTISDFVADLRAPTPSAAAELAVPDKSDLIDKINYLKNKIISQTYKKIDDKKLKMQVLDAKLQRYHPINLIHSFQQRVDELTYRLNHLTKNQLHEKNNRIQFLTKRLLSLSPYEALKRGYAIVRKENKIINSVKKVEKNQEINIKLSDGTIDCNVIKIKKEKI